LFGSLKEVLLRKLTIRNAAILCLVISGGAEVWRESDCEKANDLASMFMEGLVMQSLSGPLSKKRGREAWLADLRNALRYDRKGMWHTHERRVCQLLRSLETNLPWRTMNHAFRDQRAPLLSSIKVSSLSVLPSLTHSFAPAEHMHMQTHAH